MSSLGGTLEEVQVQILQGDLSKNAGLQPSPIPAMDKELKTKAKKIIPAINELLKRIDVLTNTVADYSTNVQTLVDAAEAALLQNIADRVVDIRNGIGEEIDSELQKVIGEQVNLQIAEYVRVSMASQLDKMFDDHLQTYFEANVSQYIDKQLTSINELIEKQNESAVTDKGEGEKMKRAFKQKLIIAKNESVSLPWKATEIVDLDQQIMVALKGTDDKYVLSTNPFEMTHASTSVYNIYTLPVDFRIAEDDSVILSNRGNMDAVVYLFDLI